MNLLFRFDLILLILDPQDEMFDRKLGGHLVSLYFKTHEDEEDENLVSSQLFVSGLVIVSLFLSYICTNSVSKMKRTCFSD